MYPGFSNVVPDYDPECVFHKGPSCKSKWPFGLGVLLGYRMMILSLCSTKDPHGEVSCRAALGLN